MEYTQKKLYLNEQSFYTIYDQNAQKKASNLKMKTTFQLINMFVAT